MAIADFGVADSSSYVSARLSSFAATTAESRTKRPLHRIRTVRLEQGMSLRSVARRTGVDIRQLRLQEQETTDLRISDLLKWQKALEVPLTDLLVEPDSPLSRPVMERARMLRLMKTARAIREQSQSIAIQRLAQMLTEQLTEIMPELGEVGSWHTYGQPRRLDEFGRAADRCLADDVFDGGYDPEEAA